MSNRKPSLFQRWKQQTVTELEGITQDEMEEFREAFRLFDKVILLSKMDSWEF